MSEQGAAPLARWADTQAMKGLWTNRAERVGRAIPAGARVLDLGCGAMEVEGFLPPGCVYLPSDVVKRDGRTRLCDYARGQFPAPGALGGAPDRVTVLGVIEYMPRPAAFLRALRQYDARVLISYALLDQAPLLNREDKDWVNHLTRREFREMAAAAGFTVLSESQIDWAQSLFDLAPAGAGGAGRWPAPQKPRSVCVISYDNVSNFGDRLGWSLLSPLLPAHAVVERHTLKPFTADVTRIYDLTIVGIGNSLFGGLFSPQLEAVARNSRWALGLFGTQYREKTDPQAAKRLIGELDLWFARYEEDRLLYGRGADAGHLGDWLITAAPMTRWTEDGERELDKKISSAAALDRAIAEIQRWRHVRSPRLHPLLCAFTSAEKARYSEQREFPGAPDMVSGKFGSMLLDVFGERYAEDEWFSIDRGRVAAYRDRVRAGVGRLKTAIETALA